MITVHFQFEQPEVAYFRSATDALAAQSEYLVPSEAVRLEPLLTS
jgi:hypothetical protein